jgi:tRNA-Thr(GGU) m(6)t(6)A37 methyltransferase TsaA
MENWKNELTLRPVGFVRSGLTAPLRRGEDEPLNFREQVEKIRMQMRQVKELVSELVIDPELVDLLDGIEEFSHIVVLYWPHLIPEERRMVARVHPMGLKALPETGVFATRSPARPNPVLISTVELLEHNGNLLKVKGLEAVDGSPIVDIKPYTEISHAIRAPRFSEWLRSVLDE